MTTSTTSSPEATADTQHASTTAASETATAPAEPAAKPGTLDVTIPRAKVHVLSINPGEVSSRYTDSLIDLVAHDVAKGYGLFAGRISLMHGSNISKGRNLLVRQFLSTDGEWALLIDSDMTFPPDLIPRMLAVATVSGARIIGGLCVMVTDTGPMPTLYGHNTEPGRCATRVMLDYPDNALINAAATGTACLLVHRGVFERMRDAAPEGERDYPWFAETVRRGEWVSEDIEFCLRAGELGYRIVVDTSLQIGHVKRGRVWYARDIRAGVGMGPRPLVAVIPVKDRLDLTQGIVGQLLSQGDVTEVVVVDNGSSDGTAEWLAEQASAGRPVTTLAMPDAGIHEMWNAGAAHAMARHGHRAYVAFLNNDLRLGPSFLRTLAHALDADRLLGAVSGNYDGRAYPDPVQPVSDICANRYDGTGGLAGFAFMVRAAWFTNGYRFPEECKWWYGDNDLVMAVLARGGRCGIAIGAGVEHLDGGGNTGQGWDTPEWREVLAADREAFVRRWARARAAQTGPAPTAEAHGCGHEVSGPTLDPIADPDLIRGSFYRQWGLEAMAKLPEDLDRYERVLAATKPEVVVECGTWRGRSAQWLAERGVDVVTIDHVDQRDRAYDHDRVTFLEGDTTDPAIVEKVAGMVAGRRAMVILDSDHHACHVAAEIAAYADLVSGGCYLVVEDGSFRWVHGTKHGPLDAIEQFLGSSSAAGWERDETIEGLHPVTQYPAGWLRRKAVA